MLEVSAERTLSEAARELALPERTLRRYLDRFNPWLPVRRRGRERVLDAESLDVLRLVREHLVAGRSMAEVERLLVERRGRVVDASCSEPGPSGALARQEDVAGMAKELARLREGVVLLVAAVEHQAEELARLRVEVAGARSAPALPPPGPPATEHPSRLRELLARARAGGPVLAKPEPDAEPGAPEGGAPS